MNKIKVAIVAYDQISAFHLSVPCLVFNDVLSLGQNPFDVKICCCEGESLSTTSYFGLEVEHGLARLSEADLVIVPSWDDVDKKPPQALLDEINRASDNGATIAGLCLGAVVLAYAGLLDGRKATTHWAYAEQFQHYFPNVEFDPEPLFIAQDKIITSAGTVAAIDCCLHIVRGYIGSEKTNALARILVTAPYRHGGQKQYIPVPVPDKKNSNTGIARELEKILASLDKEHSIDSVADRCAMSRRTFTRHFKMLTGVTFGEWLINQRLKLSQELLEHSRQSIPIIALKAGFGSESVYRKHFKEAFSVSPAQWRKTFTGYEK